LKLTVSTPSRRTVVKQILGAGVALASLGIVFAKNPIPTIRVTSEELPRIPHEFTGLSYESSQLSHSEFFKADNHDLIQFFRTLGDGGVLHLAETRASTLSGIQ
jgi:hypothetical protein